MKIVNRSRVNYEYKIGKGKPLIKETKYSNTVSTMILDQRIRALKKVDKLTASVFEIITYSIIIENISRMNIEHIVLKDKTPAGLRFIFNSVCMNGIKRRGINLSQGFIIEELKASESKIITFKAVVLPKCILKEVRNSSQIEYRYIYNIDMPFLKAKVTSNEVITAIENRIFQQLIHQSTISIKNPFRYAMLQKISLNNVKICPLTTKLIKHSNGYQVLIIGKITYEICYRIKRKKKDLRWFNIEGFSCLLRVPEGVQYCEIEGVSAEIEDATMELIKKNKVSLTTLFLMKIE